MAGKIIKENLEKETFKIFKKDCRALNFFAMGDYMEKYKLYHISDHIWNYFKTFGNSITEGKITRSDKETIVRSFRQGYVNKKRLLNKMDNYNKWIRNKYRNAKVKEKMISNDDGTTQEITEENWNTRLDLLANRAMDKYVRPDMLRLINFRFNWNDKNMIREGIMQEQFKSEHMPVKMNITENLILKPHRVYSQACSLDEFNFVFDHLRMGSTSSYNKNAILSLMSLYHARKLVEADKFRKAVAAMSQTGKSTHPSSDKMKLSGSKSQEKNEKYLGLPGETVSLGGKAAPSLNPTKSRFRLWIPHHV
jgi:hypothetical protein